MNKSVEYLKILSASTFERIKKYKYLLIISCLFLTHVMLFNIYINRAISINERHTLSAYVCSKILHRYELTSWIKLTYSINGKDYKASAKKIYKIINNPLLQPEIDRLISKAYHCAFLSSFVYIFLLYFGFNRNKPSEIEPKNREFEGKKIPLEPPARNILADKNNDEKLTREKELKTDPKLPVAVPIIQPEIHKKSDNPIDIDDDGFTEEDFLL